MHLYMNLYVYIFNIFMFIIYNKMHFLFVLNCSRNSKKPTFDI